MSETSKHGEAREVHVPRKRAGRAEREGGKSRRYKRAYTSRRSRVGRRSKEKGKEGERELAALAREAGFTDAKRTAPMQAAGYAEEYGDVGSIPLVYAEAKRYRRTPVSRFLRELLATERPGLTSVLFWRDDNDEMRAGLDAREFLNRHAELLALRSEVVRLRAQVRAMTLPNLQDDLAGQGVTR